MVDRPYIAEEYFTRKSKVVHAITGRSAFYDIKIWKINDMKKYPIGYKFSLYLYDPMYSKVILGIDNHYPKKAHIHRDNQEFYYEFTDALKLTMDFYLEVSNLGFYHENKKQKKKINHRD